MDLAEKFLGRLAFPEESPRFDAGPDQTSSDTTSGEHAGIALCRILSDATDRCVAEIFALALGLEPTEPANGYPETPPISLVATGGYGRRDVCPYSDIDVTICYMPGLKGINEISSAIFYPLWDSGIKVGHSVRTPKESTSVAAAEPDVAVSYLDARLVSGSPEPFEELKARFSSFMKKRSSRMIDDLIERRRKRSAALGEFDGLQHKAGYLQMDLKLGSGGLRDISTLEWSLRILGVDPQELLGPEDIDTLARARSDLLLLRSALHLCYRRQRDYLDAAALARLEAKFGRSFADRSVRAALAASVAVEAIVEKALKAVSDRNGKPGIFASVFSRPQKAEVASASKHEFSEDPAERKREAKQKLLETLSSPKDDLLGSLKALQASGVLSRAIDRWQKIEGAYQRDPFHTFSVDVHSMAAVARIGYAFEKAVLNSPGVWPSRLLEDLSEIVKGRPEKRAVALRLACLLHDIGKGMEPETARPDHADRQDRHAAAGAVVAREAALDLGLDDAIATECEFLVRNHLLLAETASSRDVRDPATIESICARIPEPAFLDDLFLLTLADTSATGPSVWNSWRRSLITQLYLACRKAMGAGGAHGAGSGTTREESETRFVETLKSKGVPGETAVEIAAAVPDEFLELRRSNLELAAGAVRRHIDLSGNPALLAEDLGDGFFELCVVARDAPGIFAKIAGVLAICSLSVVSAQAYTLDLENPLAIDLFSVQSPSARSLLEEDYRSSIEKKLQAAFSGKLALNYRLAKKTREWRKQYEARSERGSSLERLPENPEVHVDNDFSKSYTVIEIQAANRPRLLYDVASTLSELKLDIKSAKISTLGDRAADVFYVTDADGSKIRDPDHLKEAKEALAYSLSLGL